MSETAPLAKIEDSRLEAFCSAEGPEVFHSVVNRDDIWRPDPFDVETIHSEARSEFQRLVNRATTPPVSTAGRILLLLGESGSGKTHLMRAFRNLLHASQMGYFGYMQMSTVSNNYGRYILRNMIESLDRPYFEALGSATGLLRLSNSLAEQPMLRRIYAKMGGNRTDSVTALREWALSGNNLNKLVTQMAKSLVLDPLFHKVDIDIIVSLLYLQTGDPYLKNLVMKYLRGEDLAPHQRQSLGGIAPKAEEQDPPELIEQIGRLIWATNQNCLIVCADQLEDIYNLENAKIQFRRAMDSMRDVANRVPASIVVISCLADYYQELKRELPMSVIDRIEHDPDYIVLKSSRTVEEIRLLIEYRLRHLYDEEEAKFNPEEPIYPIPVEAIEGLAGLRTRDVMDFCRDVQEKAIKTGKILIGSPSPPQPGPPTALSQDWNDYLTSWSKSPPLADGELSEILGKAILACVNELKIDNVFQVKPEGNYVSVEGCGESLLIAICNTTPRGGHLAAEINKALACSSGRKFAIVRTTQFPTNPNTQIANLIGDLIAKGARRALIEDSEWRAMMAFTEFCGMHSSKPGFKEWRCSEKPMSSLPGLQAILGLRESKRFPPGSCPSGGHDELKDWEGDHSTISEPTLEPESATPISDENDQITVGDVLSGPGQTAILKVQELTRHVAFLGGTGSGKTTVALNIIEQLLARGIPAILVDRKGDLCCYSDDQVWLTNPNDAKAASGRNRLKETIEVGLYTPGNSHGRALSIALVPKEAISLSDDDKKRLSRCVASSLCRMMNYKEYGKDLSAQAVLMQAIYLLMEMADPAKMTVDSVIEIIAEESPALINAIGHLDAKLFKKLVNDLETLRLTKGELLGSGAEEVSIDSLLGVGSFRKPGKTRLTIISTKFLADSLDVEFWVAQFLLAVGRWISKNPSDHLQAVLLFDEADMYLPASRRPATKEPMEHLLRRARSAGLGIFLATQSPGDFDYKARDNIRTWFIGRIKEQTAINKMKPMLTELDGQIAPQLSGRTPGEFHIARDGKVELFKAHRALIAPEQIPEDKILQLANKL